MDREPEQPVCHRAGHHYEYCRLPALEWLRFQIDHVIAEKHHGQTHSDNLALSCFHCNSFKGPNISGIDPQTGKMTRLFHPRRDDWVGHFEWNGVLLTGKSPIGRTTIDVLRINHPRLVQLRLALRDEGFFKS